VHSPEMRMSNTPRLLGLDKSALFFFSPALVKDFPQPKQLDILQQFILNAQLLLFNRSTSNGTQISANCIPAERKAWRTITRPFPLCAGDAIHPVLQKSKGLGFETRRNLFQTVETMILPGVSCTKGCKYTRHSPAPCLWSLQACPVV
jgi:hypothetical protein